MDVLKSVTFAIITIAAVPGHIRGQNVSTWSSGYNYCDKQGKNLPQVETRQDMRELAAQMEEHHIQSAWLGIRKKQYNGLLWMDGTQINPALGRIQNQTQECGILSKTGALEAGSCHIPSIGGICQFKGCTKCPEEYPPSVCFNHRTSCYVVFCGVKDWYEAQTYCDGIKTKLATINDTVTMQEVQRQIILRHIKCVRYWLGLTNFKWVFNDGTENEATVRSYFWHHNEPKTGLTCVIISKTSRTDTTYGWRTEDCSKKHNVICVKDTSVTKAPVLESTKTKATTNQTEEETQSLANWKIGLIVVSVIVVITIIIIVVTVKLRKNCLIKKKQKSDFELEDRTRKIENDDKPDDRTGVTEQEEREPLLHTEVRDAAITVKKEEQNSTDSHDGTDVVNKWRERLAVHYKRVVQVYSMEGMGDWEFKLRALYTPCTLTDSTDWPPRPDGEPYDQYHRMFKQGTSEVKRVLLIGRPGCGKSILLKKITLDWTDFVLRHENDETKSTKDEIMFTSRFNLLIYIDLCKWGRNDTITDYLKIETNTDEFLNYLRDQSSKCLFILDSWDEFAWKDKEGQIVKLTNGDIFHECTIIIASKFMEKHLLPGYKDQICIIQGFSQKQAKLFVKKHFDNDNFLANLGIEIFSDPFMLQAACFLFQNDIPVTVCLTRLFVEIVLIMVNKAKSRSNEPSISSLDACKADLLSIGKLALVGLTETRNMKRVFTEKEANKIEPNVGTKGCNLGLLHRISDESRRNPIQLTFPHRLLQEFLAAIYVANERNGFTVLDEYMKDLVIAHGFQMLITFTCGLSKEKGSYFIDKVMKMSEDTPSFGVDCPDFCFAGWADNLDYVWVQLHTRKAQYISPFILKCLWEMSIEHKTVFPFRTNEVSRKQTISLQPDINFRTISLDKVNKLVHSGTVKFNKGSLAHLYNLNDDESINEDSTIPFTFLPEKTTYVFCLHNVKHRCRYHSLVEWLGNQKQLVKFYLSDVTMSQYEMSAVLKTIRQNLRNNLRALFLREVDLQGVELQLCETLFQLHNLYFFCLRKSKLAERYVSNICDVFADNEKFPDLERLDLSETNLSSAKDKLGKMVAGQKNLKELKLDDTDMTEAQTHQVCSVLAGNTSLVSLGLSNNNTLGKAIHPLLSNIKQLVNLKDLNIMNGSITEVQMMDLVKNLPISIRALLTWESVDDVKDSKIVEHIQRLENLEVVQMNLSDEHARLLESKPNLVVCTEAGGGSKKHEIAKCLRTICKEFHNYMFTSKKPTQTQQN